jgi:signal transduction histidine kinase/ActR/RegA family two-component response regulator
MTAREVFTRLAGRLLITPAVAIGMAVGVLIFGIGLAAYNEQLGRAETVQQARTQAAILAASVAAPLAFDDRAAANDYLRALRADPGVKAAGAYSGDGQLLASFTGDSTALPATYRPAKPHIENGDLIVTTDVVQGGARLGGVYLRTSLESLPRRVVRYMGIALVVLMASLMIAVLGAALASMSEAHRQLQAETRERERAEEALRQSQKMEAMGQLTGGVAHDFNNLLMVASSGLELLDRTTDPVRRERLKTGIRQAIDRGANLTQQLLTFARRAPLKTEVTDLAVRLNGMRLLLDRSLREDVRVIISSADDVWPAEVDPGQFEVAVLNVALNARDAMPNGGDIRIALANRPAESDDQADMVEVAISDSGVGLPPELISRVFEPFFTTKGVGKGTGLGLSQVYGFARASGGDVAIDSEVGKGTTVRLLIPRSTAPLPVSEPERPLKHAARKGHSRVLLVEDDDAVASLVCDMLVELGYEPTRATNAAGALDILQVQGFDLVFSDMVMPGKMSGLDLARRITAERPGLPILLTTGFSASATAAADEGLRLLVKPYGIDKLAAELQAALNRSSNATRH